MTVQPIPRGWAKSILWHTMLGYLCNANICAERNSRLHATTWIGLHQLELPTRADCLFSINIAGRGRPSNSIYGPGTGDP